jgi:hypothetical protein
MHKIIDIYKCIWVPYTCFSKRVAIFRGFLAENCKYFLHPSNFPFLNSPSQIFQLFHPFKRVLSILCFHFVLHSPLHTSTQVCRYFLYSFTSSSFQKLCPPGPCPLQPRNRILVLINKYVRLNHDVAASRTVRMAHGRYSHGIILFEAV